MTPATATQLKHAAHIPAPIEVFQPIQSHPGVMIPKLAVDTVVAKIRNDPQAFALDYLNLQQTVKGLAYERDVQKREDAARLSLHPDSALNLSRRIEALAERMARVEDRLDGRSPKGPKVDKSIEDLRESLSGVLARETV